MALIAVIFAFVVAWVAFKGVSGSTNVNLGINIIQIAALLFLSALAIAHRLGHPDGSMGQALDGTAKVLHYSFSGDAPAHPNAWSVVLPHGVTWTMSQEIG